ncbi:MAG TPA: hypothetical protein VME46_14110 [Acidimicrobiales bacterium]|nr:hypothetical protein [Acidimicrobiales bacterium]
MMKRAAAAGSLALLAVLCVSCSSGPSTFIKLSARSGEPGTLLRATGDAGQGCSPTAGLDIRFEAAAGAASGADGPASVMDVPLTAKGTWSATLLVPSYLGYTGTQGRGAPVVPGRYELVAPDCNGHAALSAAFDVTAPAPAGGESRRDNSKKYVDIVPTLDGGGYWLLQADGAVTRFGDAGWFGSVTSGDHLSSPVVGMAHTHDAQGYWLVTATGHVYAFGDARDYGSLRSAPLAPVTGIATTPTGNGYLLLSSDGRVFGFGSAKVYGMPGPQFAPFDAIATRPAGGYVVTSSFDAAVYDYPGGFLAAAGPGYQMSGPTVGTAVTPSGNGTWQVEPDGSVITTGDAVYYGGVPANQQVVSAPVTSMAATPSGQGYWLLGADGNVYNFGAAAFWGSGLR